MLAAMRRTSSRVSSFDRDQCRKTAWRLSVAHARASGRAVLAEPHNAVKVSTVCPSSLGLFLLCRSLCTGAPTPDTAFRGLLPKIPRKDGHIYEPVTCPVCQRRRQTAPAASTEPGAGSSTGSGRHRPCHCRAARWLAPVSADWGICVGWCRCKQKEPTHSRSRTWS
jgi:hypothetical protein